MTKATKLLAAVLTVIMVFSLMTCITFAATPVFADDYVSYPSSDKIPEIKSTACIVSPKARNKEVGTKINIDWDGQTWEFVAGVNAFATFDEACQQADLAAGGETPQVILSAGKYPELRIKSAVEVFGANWNDNPNVVNNDDPTKAWKLNEAWSVAPTICNDIVIDGAAAGEITIVGMEIAHRFYDSFRPQSSTKTVLKLINTYLNQTDSSTPILTLPTGRTSNMAKFAMSFWNLNSHNTGASAANNTDETHLINFRVGTLNMASDNRLIDEKVSPIFVIDGFCADYAQQCINLSWFKWAPYKTAKMVFKNSYFTHYESGNGTGWLDVCGFYTDKTPDPALGESAEFEATNNIFYNSYHSNGNADLRVFGVEFTKITFEDNLVINTDGTKQNFINMYNSPIGDLSDVIFLKNNTFLGYSIDIPWGSSNTEIDMTGSYIAHEWSPDYKNEQLNVLPTGLVRYDYCYIDGAKTIKTDAVQEFGIDGMTVDHENQTITGTVGSGIYYKTPLIVGQAVSDIYPSDKDYSNIDSYQDETPVTRCALTAVDNYFVFVAFSPDRANYKVYKMKISRPSVPGLALTSISDRAVALDVVSYKVDLATQEDSFSFKPVAEDGVKIEVTLEGDSVALTPAADGTYTVTGIEKGKDIVYNIDLTKAGARERYTLKLNRALSDACELIGVDSKLTEVEGGYKAHVEGGADKFEFTAEISEGADAFVTLGTAVYPYAAGKFVITDPKAADYKLIVVAESGKTNEFKLTLTTEKSSEAKVISVENATAKDGGFEAEASTTFTVKPTISAGAGFKVFSDAACTTLVANNTVTLGDSDVTVYIVVTAENGTVADPVALKIKKVASGGNQGGVEIEDTSAIFTDIKAKGWYKEYVDYAVAYGIFSGTSKDKFSPDSNITRAQFVQVLANLEGVDTSNRNVKTSFSDVPANKWFTAAVKWASDNKIVNGVGDGKFDPNANVTREQMCLMLVNFAQFNSITLKTVEAKANFADDAKISKWAKSAVYTCQQADIVNGKGANSFDPQGTGTRAEASVMFTKFHKDYMAK